MHRRPPQHSPVGSRARLLYEKFVVLCTDDTVLETPAPPTPPQPTANELQEGWRCASSYLRRRLLDPRSAAAASMPLRGSLEQVGTTHLLGCKQ